MAAERDLTEFVAAALAKGATRAQIQDALAQAGWRVDQVRQALNEFADVPFVVPVPRPRPYLSAREAFLSLLLFAALYDSAVSLGGLLYAFIDHAFPDVAQATRSLEAFRVGVRLGVAQLVVAFPVFTLLTLSQRRAAERDPARRASRVRKWLTYLTLFLGACVLIGDAATLLYRLLGGEVTVRFGLKCVVVGAIAGTVFTWYLKDLKREETAPPEAHA